MTDRQIAAWLRTHLDCYGSTYLARPLTSAERRELVAQECAGALDLPVERVREILIPIWREWEAALEAASRSP